MASLIIKGKLFYNKAIANIDDKYGPYNSLEEAYEILGEDGADVLAIGLTVGIISNGSITEYWFKSGIDSVDDLVPKGSIIPLEIIESIKLIGIPASDDYTSESYYEEGDEIPEDKLIGDVKIPQTGTLPTGLFKQLYDLKTENDKLKLELEIIKRRLLNLEATDFTIEDVADNLDYDNI